MGDVWVVSRDNGYEGLRPPSAAFVTRAEAEAYARHVSGEYSENTNVVNAVPLMRFLPATLEPAELPPPVSREAEER